MAALLNGVTLVFGYFSELGYANARLADEIGIAAGASVGMRCHRRLQTLAVAVLALSLMASSTGLTLAFQAI